MKTHYLLILSLAVAGFYQSTVAQTIGDRQEQVGVTVAISSTPSTPDSYTWTEVTTRTQGVDINVVPAERQMVYIHQNNAYLNFNTFNTGQIMVRMEVKYGSSGSWNVIFNNESRYDSGWLTPSFIGMIGKHTIEVKWWVFSGTIYSRVYDVYVVPKAQKLYRDNYGNTMTTWGTGFNNRPPILVSEGIDSYNRNYPEYLREIGKGLFDSLVQNGFKVYVLSYKYNPQDIRNTAAIYNSAARYVSTINSNKQIVAAGISMGGVVVRYALAKAEANGFPLPAFKFISLDSPQQGAVINLSLQNFIKNPPGPCVSGNDYRSHGLSNVAARQLLTQSAWTSLHTQFYNELRNLNGGTGYPQLTRNVGVAFSSGAANSANGTWLNVSYEGVYNFQPACGISANFTLTGAEQQSGSYLPRDITAQDPRQVFWGWFTMSRYKDPTFIPHTSALDLIGSASKFDATIKSQSNSYHDVMPNDVIQQLLLELGVTPPVFTASISGPSSRASGQSGTWTASVSNGNSPYTYKWEYQIACSGGAGATVVSGATDTDATASTAAGDPGVPQPLGVQCGVWYSGSTSSSFTHSVSSSGATLKLRLTVKDSSSPVQTKVAYKNVSIGSGATPRIGEGALTAQDVALSAAPTAYALDQNYPNPFNPSTEIRFALPEATDVRLAVYDALGREVARLADGPMGAGYQHVRFDASGLPSGVYLYRLEAGTFTQTNRMVLMK